MKAISERYDRPIDLHDDLFDRFVDAVYAYASRRVASASVAEDVTGEVFAVALGDRRRCRRPDPLPWLYGIARRRIADHQRREAVRREVPLEFENPLADGDAAEAVLEQERAALIRRWVSELPEDQREALLLFYVEGLAVRQIAESMRRTTFAVNSLLQRARTRIREQGAGYFDEPFGGRR